MPNGAASPQQQQARTAVRAGGPSVVLAGYDRTDGSSNALSYAAGLAARTGARLIVLNVNVPLALDSPAFLPPSVDQIAAEVKRVVGECLDGCVVAVDTGDPAGVIQRVAGDLQADLIIVGQSRRRWKHPLGSIPARLAHHAEQPVLIVP